MGQGRTMAGQAADRGGVGGTPGTVWSPHAGAVLAELRDSSRRSNSGKSRPRCAERQLEVSSVSVSNANLQQRKAAGGVLTVEKDPHRPGTAPGARSARRRQSASICIAGQVEGAIR